MSKDVSQRFIEITREMIEGCLDDELEIMYEGCGFKPSAPEWFKNLKDGTYEKMVADYIDRNNIVVINGRYFEPNEDYFEYQGLQPDGRPYPDDKYEPPTFGDR